MATLDSDFIRLHLDIGTYNFPCYTLRLAWPPPERMYFSKDGLREAVPGDQEKYILVRERVSELPDDIADHPNIARGAEYRYLINRGESAGC